MALGGSKLVWLTGLVFFFSTFWFTFRNQGDKLDMLGCKSWMYYYLSHPF